MVAEASVDVVSTDEGVVFRFTPPLSVMVLSVSDQDGRTAWKLTSGSVRRVPASEGHLVAIPISEAPPELLEMARLAKANALARLAEKGPSKSAIPSIRYGVAPEGFEEEAPASSLSPGEYDVWVLAEQGQAESHFKVPDA